MTFTSNKKYLILLGSAFLFAFIFYSFFVELRLASRDQGVPTESFEAKIADLVIPFVENKGQVEGDVSYYADTFAGKVGVTKDGVIYSFLKGSKDATLSFLKEQFIEGGPVNAVPGAPADARISYFKGSDETQWRSDLRAFSSVNLGEIWTDINVELSARAKNVEKIFTVAPGGDPTRIAISILGSKGLRVSESGEMLVGTTQGEIAFTKPVAYQEEGGQRIFVDVAYRLIDDAAYGFTVGKYDRTKPLVIDPLIASTYLGGSANDEQSYGVAVSTSTGSVFVVSKTQATGFPTTSGAYDETFNAQADVLVSKLNSTLTTLSASTYLGGSDYEEGYSIALDASDNVYVTGYTEGSGFPVTSGAYSETYGGGSGDAFVAKLNSTLTTLSASTFLGGTGYDQGESLVIDSSGNVFVTGYAEAGFPTTVGAYDQTATVGGIFVSKLNSTLTTLSASTFVGEDDDFLGADITVDSSNNIYVTGFVTASTYPTSTGAYGPTYSGGRDVYIFKMNSTLTTLSAATFLGTSNAEEGNAIVVDSSGNIFVAGKASTGFPVTSGAYDETYANSNDGFIAKFNSTLTTLSAATYIGGAGADEIEEITLDSSGNLYFVGTTDSPSGIAITGGYDTAIGGTRDAFVGKINSTLSSLSVATYLGGSGSNAEGLSIALDSSSNIYVAGRAEIGFPTSTGAYDLTLTGSSDGYVSKFSSLLLSSNNAPAATIGTPAQASSSNAVSFTVTVSDADLEVTSLLVEHSRDSSTWASSTLGSVTASNGTVATSTGAITSIDTNTSTTTLTITWEAGTDLLNIRDTTVYIRVRPSDGTDAGSTQTSSAFSLDTLATPTSVNVYDDSATMLTVFFTSSAYTFIAENVTTGETRFASSSPISFTSLRPCTQYSFRVKSGSSDNEYSSFSDAVQRNTLGCGGGGGGGSSAPATPATPASTAGSAAVLPAPSITTAPVEPVQSAPTIAELEAKLATLRDTLSRQTSAKPNIRLTRFLTKGVQGEEVRALQRFLAEHFSDIYPSKKVTGYYGVLTSQAVRALQLRYNITTAGDPWLGSVGPKTRAWLRGE